MIELIDIKKHFENVKAVDGISFTAQQGEIFGLIGPNGAGKSTTIRMIMNIIAPDSGRILFNGKMIREEDKSLIGYLPEERGLYKKAKVSELLYYFASLKKRYRQDYKQNIDRWLQKFGLMDWKYKKVTELSRGMSQKVQFIASVAHDPQILFFDEPFSGLDPVSADLLLESILQLGKAGKTILFSTHIMEHAEKICNKIFLINRGREVISGTIGDVKDHYGRKSIIIEFSGDGEFMEKLPQVEHLIRYPRFVEIRLKEGSSPDELLKTIVNRISIRRFEIVAPSLHNIFVSLVNDREEVKNG